MATVDVVFAVQRVGADAVAAYQFPFEDATQTLGGPRKRRYKLDVSKASGKPERVLRMLLAAADVGVFNE